MKKKITVIGKTDDAELMAEVMKCRMNQYDRDIYIRWGVADDHIGWMEINSSNAIMLARNKFESLKKFKEYGLLVPNFSENPDELKYPLLGRKYCHQEGRDIIFIESQKELVKCEYYIEFLQVQHEFRYHVLKDECIIASIKRDGEKKCYCRNLSTGWKFVDVDIDRDLEKIAVKAVSSLGLDFGAVDIIIVDYKPYVLEVNTALGIIKRRAKLYAQKFNEYIDFLLRDEEYENRVYERTCR